MGNQLRALTLLVVLTPFLPFSPAQAQRTPEALARTITNILDDPDFAEAFWGVLIVNLDTEDTLYQRDPQKRFVPASTQKLVTTASALVLLGPEFRYTTRLYTEGAVREGALLGDLVIQGAGDPTLGSDRFGEEPLAVFRAWADSLRAAGITRIAGDIVGDDNVFDDTPYGLGWAWDDFVYGYGAETSGLTFQEGTIAMTVEGTRSGARARLVWDPLLTDYVTVENDSRTRRAGARVEEGYARELSTNHFTITTEVPANGADEEALAVHNPTRYTAHTLRLVLLARGIVVEGRAVDADDRLPPPRYDRMTSVASHVSPPLAAIVEETNQHSNNLYAEHLLRTLGARFYQGREEERGSIESGVEALAPILMEAGIDPETLQLVDGSGLSFMNRLTPQALVRLLTFMARHSDSAVREAFLASLPIGGESGTLAGRYRSGAARSNVQAKTGYINSARTLAGYVTTARGERLAFALLCNDYAVPTRRVNAAQDAVVEALARYAGRSRP
ncbi:MAG: D-alanyl-D-alanine carboxypeptidase/D-alanyl-D-alanine-endopeptidase [Rhodothermaceae bacterium]|nr:D-alanyl-D-alanine carboxypeptidase/D-alanyl-D-alanine-endopeptidase [Rhodothermaceae bacterium]